MKKIIKNKKLNILIVGFGYVGYKTTIDLIFNSSHDMNIVIFDIDKNKLFEQSKRDDINKNIDRALKHAGVTITVDYLVDYDSNLYSKSSFNYQIFCINTDIKNNTPDLKPLVKAVLDWKHYYTEDGVLVIRSSTPPGTTRRLGKKLKRGSAHIPERFSPSNNEYFLENNIMGYNKLKKKKINELSDLFYLYKIEKNSDNTEFAKLYENFQRRHNISLANVMHDIAYHNKLNFKKIDKLCKTKSNYISYKPGLIGGHCIGVDDYFLLLSRMKKTTKKIIKNIIKTNEKMDKLFYKKVKNYMIKRISKYSVYAKIGIYGLTYKPNVDDFRNSKALKIAKKIKKKFKKNIFLIDPAMENTNLINDMDVIFILEKHKNAPSGYKCINVYSEILKGSQSEYR